jgi:fucose 4-O-acetylase-like acetyltransferase
MTFECKASVKKIQRQDIELLRIICAFGIVFFHATGSDIANASLIIFVIISMFLAGSRKREVTVDFVKNRIGRLIIPWITWFFIYGVFNLVNKKEFFPINNGVVSGILSGSSIHLWYIPFIFGFILFFEVIKNNFTSTSIAIACSIIASTILFLSPFWLRFSNELGSPLSQYSHVLAAVFIGVYLSYFYLLRKFISIILLALIIISSIASLQNKGIGVAYFVAISCSLMLISKYSIKFETINFSPISECMLGVYFLHVKILIGANKFIPWAGLLIPLIVFLVCTIAVYLARRLFPKIACYWS